MMKKAILFAFLLCTVSVKAQVQTQTDTVETQLVQDTLLESSPKKSFGEKVNKLFGWGKEEEIEKLTTQIKSQRVLIDSMTSVISNPRVIIKTVPALSAEATKSIKRDEKFVSDLPKSYGNLSKEELDKVKNNIDAKIAELIKQRDSLVATNSSQDLIDAKGNIIQSLNREKQAINLSNESLVLKDENDELIVQNDDLKVRENTLKKYLYVTIGILFVLALITAVVIQRKTIRHQDDEIADQLKDISKKNTYLEHAARIIRHDMHSGINTYIPRGIGSLEKRLSEEESKKLKIDGALKMIKEGLAHTQKVYKSVYEFTNLVKQHVVLNKSTQDLKELLDKYLSTTSYKSQVTVENLVVAEVNETLFCNAIDNLIKNGLKYNDSEKKEVRIYIEEGNLIVQDNGRGLTQKEFDKILNSYKKKGSEIDEETTGLGLNICLAILTEHGFSISCEKNDVGTKMKIKLT